MNDLRLVLVEKMTTDIKNFTIWPVKLETSWFVTKRNKFDEEFEPGWLVKSSIDGKLLNRYFVKKIGNNEIILKEIDNGDKTETISINNLWGGEIASMDCKVENIEHLSHNWGV